MKTNERTIIIALSLLACLLAACNRKPTPSKAEISSAISNAMSAAMSEMGKQLAAADKEMDRKSVTILIDGVRDDAHHSELYAKVQHVEDSGTKNNRIATWGGYYQHDALIRISPVSDIQAAAEKIDFGLVLAVDETTRVILLDASAKPAARPPNGWPGAEAIKAHAVRKTLTYAAGQAFEPLVTQFGADKVVVVWMPEQKGASRDSHPSPDDHPLVKKLRAIAPQTICHSLDFGPKNAYFVSATIAPAPSFADVMKNLEGSPILASDEKSRVVIVGDVNDLIPSGPAEDRPAK
jgi:hypothetical protein